MIRIIRVTNPIDPSRDKEVQDLEHRPGWTLLEYFADPVDGPPSDFDAWAGSVTVSLNGHVWARSLWGQVTPKDGDCIVVAPVVAGGGLLRTLASVALLAGTAALALTPGGQLFAAGIATSLGGALLGASTAAAILAGAVSIAGNLLISAFLGPAAPATKTDTASYDPDGPRSLARSGVVIPKGYGTFRWGGNIISSFTEINGSDQFINVLVCFGFGPARSMTGIQLNGKDIANYQNCAYFTRLGTNDQTEIASFNQIVNGYPQQTQTIAGVPVIVPGTGDLTQALQVDVSFPSGVFVNTSKGNIIPAVITYQVQYRAAAVGNTPAGPWISPFFPQNTVPVVQQSANGNAYLPHAWGVIATDLPPGSNVVYTTDDGPHNAGDKYTGTITCEVFQPNGNHNNYDKAVQGEWQLLDINQNYVQVTSWTEGYVDFVGASTSPLYNRTTILGLAPAKYDVQVIKYGSNRLHDDVGFGDNSSPTIGQDLWVHSVNEVTYLDLVYPNMILLGIRALATSQLSGANLNVTALIEHGLRSKDQGLLPPALAAFEEDNPACVAADMLLDDLYGGGAWPGIGPQNLTRYLDEWVGWAENNDQLAPDGNGNSIRLCVYNGVIDNEGDLWTQAQSVAAMSRAAIVPMGLDYGVALDAPVDAPVQMFTVGNTLQDSFSEIWLPVDERSNQVEVQFADATRYYKQDNPLVYMDPDALNNGTIPKATRINGKGITSPAQAYHFARYKQRSTALLLRSGSFKTDTSGLACRPFNVVALQSDVPMWSQGGRLLPGSTTTLLLPDRTDLVAPAGTGAGSSVTVLHPAVQRFTGTVGPVVSVTSGTQAAQVQLSVGGWDNAARITRAIVVPAGVAAVDCAVTSSAAGTVTIALVPGLTPATGQGITLWDTDVMETVGVTALDPATGGMVLAAPLSQPPAEYATYLYGLTGGTKLVRVTSISKSDWQRSKVEWIDYDPDVYTVATPLIGETSAQQSSNPGVTSLTGSETFSKASGSYVSYASLAWNNGPDTVGVGIYAQHVGAPGLAQLVARLPGPVSSYQVQQSPDTTMTYTVVGYDTNNNYAGFTTAPSVTVDAVGIAVNLLQGSSFANGFTNWSVATRSGDSLVPTFQDDGSALYTVAGTALTAPLVIATQAIPVDDWQVGGYLLLSAYFAATGMPTGTVAAQLVFAGASGVLSTVAATLTLTGTAAGLTRVWTPATAVPAGTTSVTVQVAFGGSGLSFPVGTTVELSHLLLEAATAGQTLPSAWADIDVNGQVLDLFTTGSSAGLRTQASALPQTSGSISYAYDDQSITLSWEALTIYWPDGGITSIQDGSFPAVTGLTASTKYWAFLFFDVLLGKVAYSAIGAADGTPPELYPAYDAAADAACFMDNRAALTPGGMQITTGAAAPIGGGGGGTGTGSGGGATGGFPNQTNQTLNG